MVHLQQGGESEGLVREFVELQSIEAHFPRVANQSCFLYEIG